MSKLSDLHELLLDRMLKYVEENPHDEKSLTAFYKTVFGSTPPSELVTSTQKPFSDLDPLVTLTVVDPTKKDNP
ncbi:hypothetical protein ACNO7T_08050 [Vibrio campbellii]